MRYTRFLFFNVVGGLLWGIGVTAAGCYLGQSIPNIDRYFLVVVAAVIVLSALPAMIHLAWEYGPLLRRNLVARSQAARAQINPDASPD